MSKRHKLLVVDDDSMNLSIMEEILSDHYDLLLATTGEECLQLARESHPDLILLDIMLPGIDGYETCRQLRNDPQIRYAKVVLVSAKSQLEERLEGYKSHADDYITKPFDENELLAKVRVLLRLQYMEQLDEFKSQFLDLLAHETRTPLTAILSPTQILRDTSEVSPQDRRELSQIIYDSAQTLQRLIQGTVELCSFKAGRIVLIEQVVDLNDIVAQKSKELEPFALSKSITFAADASQHIHVMGDEERLEQSIGILLENAIAHGFPETSVKIRLETGPRATIIEVEHKGEVLPEEQLPYVFEAFRVHDLDHYSSGVGIDLAVAREIVLLHHGILECRVASTDSMIFRLVLPSIVGDPSDIHVDPSDVESIRAR